MKSLDYFAQLDNQILEELNIKQIVRPIAQTEKGKIELVYDGTYKVLLDGEDKTTPRLLEEFALPFLSEQYRRKGSQN